MKLKSLIQNGQHLEVAEVELEFIPGIPQIHFLGLPDRIIKESFYRIKSALKSSGYKFPLTQQMIVNIKPQHLRKSSRGVELAVALGILLKTKQIAEEKIDPGWVLYGELGLDGAVYEPTDLVSQFSNNEGVTVLTGWAKENQGNFLRLNEIKNFEVLYPVGDYKPVFERPEDGLQKIFSVDEGNFLFLSAMTGFHGLLAGDAGAGKSTLAKALHSFLPDPTRRGPAFKNNWPPMVAPHSTITSTAFLGGGAQIYRGEVERAQDGLLILDELLEFEPEIVETLRGPMTGDKLRLVRASQEREIDCRFQIIATTNLCLCGKWTPEKNHISCRYSRLKCEGKMQKLSGPFLDRFALMMFTPAKSERNRSGFEVLERLQQTRAIKEKLGYSPERAALIVTNHYSDYSARRQKFLTEVAHVFYWERASKGRAELGISDYNDAEKWVLKPFLQLEKGMS